MEISKNEDPIAVVKKKYYQFPEGHDQELRSFVRILLSGLFLLVICGAVLIWYADRILIHIPFQMEKDFVRPYERLLLKYWIKEDHRGETDHYLQLLADQLKQVMQMTESVTIRVHYVDSETVNAFATLGGNIFVFKGLLETLPDENSLAMILAHEIAHVKHRDPIVSLSRGAMLQMAFSYLTGNSGDVFSAGSEMGLMFFSREQETKADHEAVSALHRLYGHVAGATTFFEMMSEQQDRENKNLPEWFSSHPKLTQRVDAIKAYIVHQGWKYGEVTSMPEMAMAR